MGIHLRPAWLVARRELRDQFRDWRIILPVVSLTIFFPFLMNFTARVALDFVAQYGAALIAERLVPFLLMVVGFFPITVSLVIPLETFVGEKERGTIEPLLSSPLKDWQLYLGKLIAASSIPLLAAYIGIMVYLAGLYWQNIAWPDGNILVQTIALTTAQAVLMVSGAMVISTQATSVRSANLLASFIIIPMALLIQGESVLMFWGNNQVLWLAVLAVLVLTALLVRLGLAHFQREALLGRDVDVLNLRWIRRTFVGAFRGGARSIGQWYRDELMKTLKRIALPVLFTILLGIFGVVFGFSWVSGYSLEIASELTAQDISQAFEVTLGNPVGLEITFPFVWLHNLRAITVIFLLGLFSFGVLGILAYVGNMGLLGGVLAALKVFGYSPLTLLVSGILPHGIFEIPALILSSAVILHIGAVLVTPLPQRTLGEVLLEALADWFKINLGLALPLLTIAAVIETWITPWIMRAVIQ